MFLNHLAVTGSTALWVLGVQAGNDGFFMERQGSLKQLFEDKVSWVDLSVHYQYSHCL